MKSINRNGMILSLIALIGVIVGYFAGIFLTIPAIICGHISRSNYRDVKNGWRLVALAGLTFGYLQLIIVVYGLIFIQPKVKAHYMLIQKEMQAKTDMLQINVAIGSYVIKHGEMPATMEILRQSRDEENEILTEIQFDPWGQPYVYSLDKSNSNSYSIFSLGPDGIESPDDVYFPKE